jgi:hypothetical protein
MSTKKKTLKLVLNYGNTSKDKVQSLKIYFQIHISLNSRHTLNFKSLLMGALLNLTIECKIPSL